MAKGQNEKSGRVKSRLNTDDLCHYTAHEMLMYQRIILKLSSQFLIFIYSTTGLLICRYELLWQNVSVDFLILRWLDLLFTFYGMMGSQDNSSSYTYCVNSDTHWLIIICRWTFFDTTCFIKMFCLWIFESGNVCGPSIILE